MGNNKTEFKEYEISQLIEEISMGPFGSNIKVECFTESGIPVLNGSNLVGLKLNEDSFNYVTEEKANSLGKANAHRGDIVITHRGTLGQIVFIPENSKYDRYVISQSQFRIKCNEKVLPQYLVYYFHTRIGQHTLLSNASQVGVPSLARPTSTFQKLVVTLPPIATQKKIAEVLSSLDDKIELNNKINANLEQQAQAIFKSWFVDFEPFGGEMPAGWKVGKLSEILKLKKNTIQPGEDTTLSYLPIDLIPIKSLAINEVRPNEEALSSLLKFDENDILIGAMRVYFHRVAVAPFDGITRTTCFVLEPFDSDYWAYSVITCNQDLAIDYAQKTSKGSTMPYAVWDGGLGEFEIPIPDKKTAHEFNCVIKPMLEQLKKSYFENKNLKDLRDTLLPKLMSGELEV